MKKTIAFIFILGTSFLFSNEISTIAVTGIGTVSEKPDTFTLTATIETSDKNSQPAIDENAKIVNTAIALLKKTGLTDANLTIENYTLNYRTDYSAKINPNNNEMKYFVRNQIRVISNNLKSTDKILSALNKSGVNNIGEIDFYISNRKKLENDAYILAYEDAKSKANLIANLENLKIRPKSIDLGFSSPRPLPFMQRSSINVDTPLSIPSSIDVTANLNAIFYMEK